MNKILVDGDIYYLETSLLNIEVTGNCILYILNYEENIDLNINMLDNSILTVYDFNKYNKTSKINIIQNNNSILKYYHAFMIDETYDLYYQVKILGNNNINELKISGISNGIANIIASEDIKGHTKDNEILEDIRILTIDGTASVSPILKVNTLNVLANHNTAISNINDEELFYLMSKGLTKEAAKKLIIDGYLYGLFNDSEILNMISGGGE